MGDGVTATLRSRRRPIDRTRGRGAHRQQIADVFFFNDPATTESYTLSLHDALPISPNMTLPAQFYYITLQFLPHWARAVIFGALGVALLLYSYIKLTQSVLGPFLPGNSTGSLVDVIHAFRLKGRGPRIVAIGGGTGLSALLRGLKTYTSNLSAIVTVADDGGSSGRLRDEYRILPPGDFRQCLIALADAEPLMKQLFDHRFTEGSLNGHSFGNLFIMAMADVTRNFEHALRESGKVLAVKGTILPSTLQDVTL